MQSGIHQQDADVIINAVPSIINHHQPSSTIINHHQPSSTIINRHQPSSTIINHHQPSSTNMFFCSCVNFNKSMSPQIQWVLGFLRFLQSWTFFLRGGRTEFRRGGLENQVSRKLKKHQTTRPSVQMGETSEDSPKISHFLVKVMIIFLEFGGFLLDFRNVQSNPFAGRVEGIFFHCKAQ